MRFFYTETRSDIETALTTAFYTQIDAAPDLSDEQKQEKKDWYDQFLSSSGADAVGDFGEQGRVGPR